MAIPLQTTGNASFFREEDINFRLGDVQMNTLKNDKVKAALEYTNKNQNTIRVPSNSAVTQGSEIVFRFDKSYLASNSYLNRAKMIGQFELILAGNVSTDGFTDGDGDSAFVASGSASAGMSVLVSRRSLYDPRNSGVDSFILNKWLTKREIDFSGKSIQGQSFNEPADVDELTTLYNQDSLEYHGIYPELKGGEANIINSIYGLNPGRISFYDEAQSSMIRYGDDNEYLMEQALFKRMTNKKYVRIYKQSFFKADGITPIFEVTYTRNGQGLTTYVISGDVTYASNIITPDYVGLSNAGIDFVVGTPNSSTANIVQKIYFEVEEDLISDLFTNIYVNKPRFYAMNSAELNFRFTQTNRPNMLYKTANSVSINNFGLTKLFLEFKTFNLGSLQIPFKDFEIPFFLTQVDSQTYDAGTTNTKMGTASFPIISYTTVPHYIKIDNIAPFTNANGPLLAAENVGMSNVQLTIDNDVNMAFQQKTYDDLVEDTLVNVGKWEQNWKRIARKMPIGTYTTYGDPTGTTYPANYQAMITTAGFGHKNNALAFNSSLPFLFLKVGTDIRLPVGLEPGMKAPSNFNFTVNVDNQYGPTINPLICRITAYTCAKYIISPRNGLINTEQVSFSRDEWLNKLNSANKSLATMDTSRLQEYSTPDEMVIGGSWFSALSGHLRPILTGIKRTAQVVDKVANALKDEFKTVAPIVGDVSRFIHQNLEKHGYGQQVGGMQQAAMESMMRPPLSIKKGKNSKYM